MQVERQLWGKKEVCTIRVNSKKAGSTLSSDELYLILAISKLSRSRKMLIVAEFLHFSSFARCNSKIT